MKTERNVVGVIPAAGFANRLSSIKHSKEVYPISKPGGGPKPVASYLIDHFRQATIHNLFIIIRNGKWDIPEQLSRCSPGGSNIAYLISEATAGAPYTIDVAYPFIHDSIVALGFPDILFTPGNVFLRLIERQRITAADLVLGLFPVGNPQKTDMVAFNGDNELSDIIVKPEYSSLKYTWMMAVWTPTFTQFMHHTLASEITRKVEMHVGDVFREAIRAGMKTSQIIFDEGRYLDIGTPDDLAKAAAGQWFK